MANTSALKSKGAPPTREDTPPLVQANPRSFEGKKKPIQVMVPPEVFLAFSARAGAEFGFMQGSKSRLFPTMWKAYNSTYSR